LVESAAIDAPPSIAVSRSMALECTRRARLVDRTIAQDRMLAQLSGFFGLTAAALVGLELYGLTACEVSRRTAEIGMRIALNK
jgi:hypothetical protein